MRPSDYQMRPGHETRGLSRVSRMMSRVTIKWQDCSCRVTISWLPDRELSNDTLYCNNDKRYLVITPSPDASLDTWLLPALVLKDKFIVATFLRTSLLKISVELCFILPWINWISESSLRVHHAGWSGFCWFIFCGRAQVEMSHCVMIVCGEAWQEHPAHILTQSIRTWHLDFYQFRFLISLMDKS